MKFTTSDNVSLFYTDTQENKPPIICLPGLGASHELWMLVKEQLRKKYRVIILDARNQGLSQRTSKGQRMSRHAKDLAELIDYLNLKNSIAIGNSMGAATLFAYLAIYGSKNLKAVVDLDQSPKMIADKTWLYGFKELDWSNFPEFLKKDLGKAHYAHLNHQMVKKAKDEYKLHPYEPKNNYQFLVDHALQDWRDVLDDLDIPVLILAGRESPYFDYHFAEELSKKYRFVDSAVIEDCGHIIQAEQPTKMVTKFYEFLQKHQLA